MQVEISQATSIMNTMEPVIKNLHGMCIAGGNLGGKWLDMSRMKWLVLFVLFMVITGKAIVILL